MQVVPVQCACPRRTGEIGTDAPCTPEMRVIELRLPRERRRTEPGDIGVEIADLLRMAVRAPFTCVDAATALLADAEAERHGGRHATRLIFKHTARPVPEQHDRHQEESDAAHTGHQVGHAERAPRADAHAGSVVADATRGLSRSAPRTSTTTFRSSDGMSRRVPVVTPTSNAMNPAA